jgi:hypothetical protein
MTNKTNNLDTLVENEIDRYISNLKSTFNSTYAPKAVKETTEAFNSKEVSEYISKFESEEDKLNAVGVLGWLADQGGNKQSLIDAAKTILKYHEKSPEISEYIIKKITDEVSGVNNRICKCSEMSIEKVLKTLSSKTQIDYVLKQNLETAKRAIDFYLDNNFEENEVVKITNFLSSNTISEYLSKYSPVESKESVYRLGMTAKDCFKKLNKGGVDALEKYIQEYGKEPSI